MAVVRYTRNPDSLDRIFDQLTSNWFASAAPVRRTAAPSVSADVRDGNLEISVDLPGVPQDAVSIEVIDRALTIRVEHHTDRSQLSWARSVRLDRSLDAERTTARYDHGRLTVTVPAAPKPEPKVVKVEIVGPAGEPSTPAIDTSSAEAGSASATPAAKAAKAPKAKAAAKVASKADSKSTPADSAPTA